MKFLKITSLVLAVVALTACQNVKSLVAKRGNGSLDYTTAQKLPPIQLPAKQQTAQFVPLYDVPEANGTPIVEAGAKRYTLPAPPKTTR